MDGTLTEEKLQILYAIGFEFGDVAQLTQEWEVKFDQLLEWIAGQVRADNLIELLHAR